MFAHSKKTFFAFLAENDQALVLITHRSQNGKYLKSYLKYWVLLFLFKIKKSIMLKKLILRLLYHLCKM